MKKKSLWLFGIFFALLVVLLTGFIYATTIIWLKLPVQGGNYTTSFNFTCNTTMANAVNATLWYNASGGPTNYSLVTVANWTAGQTIFYNTTVVSLTGLTGARTYNFTCQVWNTSSEENSTSVTSVTIDNTAPVITLPEYTNATPRKNSTTLTLNISLSDATIGLNGTLCLIDVNTTNQSITRSGGWCNGTIGLTGLTDGNHTLKVYVNDTLNNFGLNNSYVVLTDMTVPTVSASCSPSNANIGSTVTCTCSGTDATSGINSSLTSAGSTITATATGTYSYGCSVTDNAGNSNSATATYDVVGTSSGTPGTTTPSFWSGTHIISEEAFEKGANIELQAKKRAKVSIEGGTHYVGVISLTESKATINISSNPVQVILDIGEDAKVDVTDDGFYDIYVILNAIADNKADVTIKKIHEEVPEGAEPVETTGELGGEEPPAEEGGLTWLWILIGVIVLIIVIGGVAVRKRKQ